MLTIFWDSEGPVLEIYLECLTTVTSPTSYDMLQRMLKPVICSERRGRLSGGAMLLHDNACPLTSTSTL